MNMPLASTHIFAAGAACSAINHVLGTESWAAAELAKHVGKSILLKLPLGDLLFEITEVGFLKALEKTDQPTLVLEVSMNALTDLAKGGRLREQAFKAVTIIGDADLAQLLGRLAGQLRWEYEEDLARLIGDAPANFAVKQGKRFVAASRSAAEDLLENVVEYVSEERKVLLNKREFTAYKASLNDLRESVDRLEKRIQFLEQKVK